MFKEISKINSYGEQGKALIKVEEIVGIKENHVEPTILYDSNGNVVSTTPNPKDFTLKLNSGISYHINESQYNELVQLLTQAQ